MATYDAFISYSHAKDKPIAAALQTVIQKLGKPWYQRRALRVFRDDTSLAATPELWPSIEEALKNSRYLVLLASPDAAASPWVAKEVAFWLEHKSINTLLVALTEGALDWDEETDDFRFTNPAPLPSALQKRFSREPKWVNLTACRAGVSPRDREFVELAADFAAAIHGMPKEDGSGVVEIVRNLISSGNISTKVAEPLLDVTRKTIQQLDSETPNEKLSSLQWRLLNALSFASVNVPGQGENAVDLARKMLTLSQELVAAVPDNDDYLELLINSEIRVGDTLEARGLLDDGLQHHLRARQTLLRLVDKDTANGDRMRVLVYLQQRIGDMLRKKDDLPKALREYEGNLALARSLAGKPQAKPDWVRAQALAHQRMGDILRDGGDHAGALGHFRAYRDLMESLVKTELPNIPNWTWRLDLWIGHQRIGDILFAQKDYPRALAEYEFYNKRAEEAARLDAENGEWQRFLANSHMMIGDVLLAQNSAARALAQYTTAVAIYRDVAKDFRPRSLRNLALGHYRMGLARLAMEDFIQARAEFEACLGIRVDESALDAQILTPKFVHGACRESSAQTTGSIAGR